MAPTPRLLIHPDEPTAAVEAAHDIAARLRDAIDARGVAYVAVSGGATATPMLEALAHDDLPWTGIHVYQVDERVAEDGHSDRNATALRAALLDKVPIPPANVHLLPVTAPDLRAAAAAFGASLPRFDAVHMGIGPDGHTASWPPGDPVIDVRDQQVVVVGPFNGRDRMTITPAVTDDARAVVFLVVGANKREALAHMLAGDPATPASHVPFERTVIHADRAAAPAD
jgi:6-phosphogluconolactonase